MGCRDSGLGGVRGGLEVQGGSVLGALVWRMEQLKGLDV